MIPIFKKKYAGSYAFFKIMRNGKEKVITSKIHRKKLQSLFHKVLTYKSKQVLYIKLSKFYMDNVCHELRSIINIHKNKDGIIFDLRDNGGGASLSGQCIASLFLKNGDIIYTQKTLSYDLRRPNDFIRSSRVDAKNTADISKPIMIIQNRHTASASEILSIALKENNRAYIVGENSYGKTIGQRPMRFHEEFNPRFNSMNILFYITKDVLFSPFGNSYFRKGLAPHLYLGERHYHYKTLKDGGIIGDGFNWSYNEKIDFYRYKKSFKSKHIPKKCMFYNDKKSKKSVIERSLETFSCILDS